MLVGIDSWMGIKIFLELSKESKISTGGITKKSNWSQPDDLSFQEKPSSSCYHHYSGRSVKTIHFGWSWSPSYRMKYRSMKHAVEVGIRLIPTRRVPLGRSWPCSRPKQNLKQPSIWNLNVFKVIQFANTLKT